MVGRKPIHSAQQKRALGNPGKRPIHDPPSVEAIGDGSEPPEWLSDDAKWVYRHCLPHLKGYGTGQVDIPAWVLTAHSVGVALAAAREQIHGKSAKVRKEAARDFRQQMEVVGKMASRFGLTPADRMRFFTVKDKPAETDGVLNGAFQPAAARREELQ